MTQTSQNSHFAKSPSQNKFGFKKESNKKPISVHIHSSNNSSTGVSSVTKSSHSIVERYLNRVKPQLTAQSSQQTLPRGNWDHNRHGGSNAKTHSNQNLIKCETIDLTKNSKPYKKVTPLAAINLNTGGVVSARPTDRVYTFSSSSHTPVHKVYLSK